MTFEMPRHNSSCYANEVPDPGRLPEFMSKPVDLDSLGQILDLAADAMVLSNSRGEIARVNAATERLLGYSREELQGQKVEILVPARFRDGHEAERAHFHGKGHGRPMGRDRELAALRKDGNEIPVEISIGLLGKRGLHLSVIVDISERKKTQAELEKARLQLIASDRLAAIGRMAAGVAHEISNPQA